MTAPNKLIFNFSSETVSDNYMRKKAATPRRKQAEVLESPAIVVDNDRSPLFEPLSHNTPDETEMIPQADDASEGAHMSIKAGINRQRADPPKTPARVSASGRNSQLKASTYRSISQAPLRPDTVSYRDGDSVRRDIWQPGDGNGVRDSEFPGKALFKERYRFFQSDIGSLERGTNSPPHFVALDDKAVWDIVISQKYTAKEKGTYWPLDFMANGTLRAQRRHKGRAAMVANESQGHVQGGDNQSVGSVPWIKAGSKPNVIDYYLSGEDGGYKEVVFGSNTVRDGTTNQTVTAKGSRHSGNKTDYATAGATKNFNSGSKTDYATKRKADQPLNPWHDRPKVGKYLHSTPSPDWPGGIRRLNKPPAARAVGRNGGDPLDGSEWSPTARVGGKTVYARYDYDEEPERINGRLVASAARTPYAGGAKTPYQDHSIGARIPCRVSSFEAKTPGPQVPRGEPAPYCSLSEAQPSQQPLWQDVKRMGEELEQVKGVLRMRDEEVSNLKAQINVLDADRHRVQQAISAMTNKDGEIQRLKEEIRDLKQYLR
ncbi:hypothetical protein QM012_006428 [Aureobasidium pullulans]|uniref:Uncharacterized protein n=1 Tax=Aureobasidium pullulans TaxID=5580 RepID=A0ABR0TNI4_AURPU